MNICVGVDESVKETIKMYESMQVVTEHIVPVCI